MIEVNTAGRSVTKTQLSKETSVEPHTLCDRQEAAVAIPVYTLPPLVF